MADILQALQSAGAPEKKVDISAAINSVGDESPQTIKPSAGPTAGESFVQGFGDIIHGGARLLTNALPNSIVDPVNKLNNYLADKTGLVAKIPEGGVNEMVSQREQKYQQARAEAGQNGIDWWRIAGNAAQPGNYIGGGKAAQTIFGRIGQSALQGGIAGGLQSSAESTTPGNYWWDMTKGAASGAATGGILGGLVEGASSALKYGVNKVRSLVSSGEMSSTDAAKRVVDDSMKSLNADPNSVSVPAIKAMTQEVQSALDHGADVSPNAIVNRIRAESLPVPVQLTRGQATGDAMQFAKEMNLRGMQGVGEPLTNRFTQQNAAFIENLDALGAKNARDPVDISNNYSQGIQSMWDRLQNSKNQLYEKVRNQNGQSASIDGVSAADAIKSKFDSPAESHIWNQLPSNIRQTIDDIRSGDFPLTLAQAQSLDKQWGRAAMGAPGDVSHALNEARSMLLNAPLTDSVGQEAKAAYTAAKQAHAQQMSLIDPKLPNGFPNPNFQPMVKAVIQDGKPPEQLFDTHFMKAAPSVAQKNLEFLSGFDPNAPKEIGQTLMSEIKRQALNSSSAERGTVSESVLRGWANDPVKSARLQVLMPKPAVDTFNNLAHTVEVAKKIPVASAVNTSNTGSSLVNAGLSMLQNSAVGQVTKRMPILRGIAEGFGAAKTQSDVQSALTPGVSLKSLMSASPMQAAINRGIAGAATPTAVELQRNSTKQREEQ